MEGQPRTCIHCPLSMLTQLERDGPSLDDWISPSIEVDTFREQFCANPVCVTQSWIHNELQLAAHHGRSPMIAPGDVGHGSNALVPTNEHGPWR
jgi:hypothetical protein